MPLMLRSLPGRLRTSCRYGADREYAGRSSGRWLAFLIVQYPIASTTRPTVARGLYVEEGGFRIVINVERGRGTADMREMGAELGALFRDVNLTNGVQCLVPTEPFTDDTSDQGNFFRGSLVVPFRYVYSA
jgi:hypothetical protein